MCGKTSLRLHYNCTGTFGPVAAYVANICIFSSIQFASNLYHSCLFLNFPRGSISWCVGMQELAVNSKAMWHIFLYQRDIYAYEICFWRENNTFLTTIRSLLCLKTSSLPFYNVQKQQANFPTRRVIKHLWFSVTEFQYENRRQKMGLPADGPISKHFIKVRKTRPN